MGEMNFSIYGCCLASQQSNASYILNSSNNYSQKRKANTNVCFQWNNGLHVPALCVTFHTVVELAVGITAVQTALERLGTSKKMNYLS